MERRRAEERGPVRIPVGSPGHGPYAVLVHPDGTVWTTLTGAGQVARIDPSAGGSVELVDLGAGSAPSQLALDPAGGVWCTCGGLDAVRRVDRAGADAPVVDLPPGSTPYGLAAGQDGLLWFTAYGAEAVGRFDPARPEDGAEPVVLDEPGMPSMITTTVDGGAWFTLNRTGALGRTDRNGAVEVHPLPDRGCGPVGIAADAETVWFAEILAGRVGAYDLATGHLQEIDLPGPDPRPHAVVPDGSGGCWVTLWGAAALAHVDHDGTVRVHDVLEAGDEPHGLALDEDALWVALESGFVVRLPR